jgi:hypothetical protein|tara:strand:- start:51 stop:365 length:315 start_codon:yes stop_codon:yes gene_type:complete
MTNRVSSEEMYAIKYLDSGGDPEKFSNRHKKIHAAIKNEAKRRFMVDIRHKINKSKKAKKKVYKIIKKSPSTTINPNDLYDALGKLSYSNLKNLKKSILQPSKE